MRDLGDDMTGTTDEQRREQGRERSEAYRERRRRGRMLVPVEVGPHHFAALERLALLDAGERDKASIAWAVSRFLDAAPHVSALGGCTVGRRRGRNRRCVTLLILTGAEQGNFGDAVA
jgi:hypothetical protein